MAMAVAMAMAMAMEAKRVSLLSLPFYAPYSNQGFSDRIKIRKKGGGRQMVPELAGLLERILLSVQMGNFWSTEIQTVAVSQCHVDGSQRSSDYLCINLYRSQLS